ncbi:helix-turn-helix transcriptional regulator [Streptomyces albidoflavus]
MRATDHAAVVARIEGSLGGDLRLERIAERAGYSPYHLHRSFRRAFGLTLNGYVRRRRLTEAARALAGTTDPVIEIALRYGFRGQHSFTNAFSAAYGTPPAAWRRARRFFPLLLPYRFDAAAWELAGATGPDAFAVSERTGAEPLLALSPAAVDMLPGFDPVQHAEALGQRREGRRVLLAHRAGQVAAAAVLDAPAHHIEYLAVHPLARGAAVLPALLHAARVRHPRLTVTTFRAGDRADLGHRAALLDLGFRPASLREEFGHPTQLLTLDPPGAPL